MSRHLTREQLSEVVIGEPRPEQLRHLCECPACEAELAELRNVLVHFRRSATTWSELPAYESHPVPRFAPRTLRAFAAACVLVFALAGLRYTEGMRRTSAADAQLLDRISADVSRPVPGRLEPLLVPEIR